MKDKKWHLKEAIAFYQSQGAPHDRQALVELLAEVQREKGGVIPKKSLRKIADAYDVKKSLLRAVIRQTPALRLEQAPHKLKVCGKRPCASGGGERLAAFIEQTYGVSDGGISESGCFCYQITHCLRQCGSGPVIKWDGTTYPHATPELIRDLVDGKQV